VVERVGLVASSFQFFTRLATVFSEEFGGGCFPAFAQSNVEDINPSLGIVGDI